MTFDTLTLREFIKQSARRYDTRPALSFIKGGTITYRELDEKSLQLAAALRELGIRPGDRVAIVSANMPNWGLAYFAVSRMKAVTVPILPDFPPSDMVNILIHAGVSAVFVSRKLYPKLKRVSEKGIVIIFIEDFSLLKEDETSVPFDLKPFEEKSEKDLGIDIPKEDDVASIIYTSGTTGQSKGVMLSHRNLVFDALATSPIPGIKPGDTLISILPLSHTYECTIGMIIPLMLGAHVHYLDRPPAPSVLLPALKEIRPSLMLSVPLLIEKIYRQSILPLLNKKAAVKFLYRIPPFRKMLNRIAGKKLMKIFGGRLYFFGIGGAALAPDVEKFLREAQFPYAIGYGLTETSPLIAGCSPSQTRYTSTGTIIPGVVVKLGDLDPVTGEGEILVKGPNVMIGYYRDEKKSAEAFTEDGWFRTGDLGVFDKDGFLYIKGRSKNMILGPSGENIYPESIEAVINQFDFVTDSLVFEEEGKIFARVHVDYDQIKEAFSHLADSAGDISHHVGEYLNELKIMANKRLSSFSKLHDLLEQHEPFEKTPTQKIKRYLYSGKTKRHNKGNEKEDGEKH
ncbi:AMP-binding protein [Sediminispirochaeta bajacaliforniensis]|uniref:AMP-binding protein n=1 Tax=Sediminispirochaeta bajacaliforniensis TaxID=148 RepID=UPI00036CBAAA|nr:AMP-binding protein [Sediminispirochaeta bajacaliforniensis]